MAPESIHDRQAASLRVHELAHSLGVTAALVAAARLRIADAIDDDDTVDVDELAKRVDADPGALGQLMRMLAARGVFVAAGPRSYGHNAESRALRADAPGSRLLFVLLAGAPFAWQVWSRLDEAVRSGDSVFPAVFGKDLFTYLAEDDPDASALFDAALTSSAAASATLLADLLPVTGTTTVADIGGGQGKVVRGLLERHPQVQAVLFDTPRALTDVDPALRGDGALAGRCSIVSGDARQEVPVQADVYLIKGVLHMWNDATAVRALRAIRRSAPAGARIIVIEQLLDAGAAPGITTVIDLLMLVTQGGKERTADEFMALFEQAGLQFRGITPAGPMNHLIEAVVPAT
ncbi:methyltransferase [Nucisporomicrobium flavum]|jgi:C-methyltransferase|uniref:methyltransferase n=1 Tax=Nucisporomicrobium flavum TaxID=2785915 RepID=UPI0018F287A2|nr:methyltransferase [Nucisporomicrobium flavum]